MRRLRFGVHLPTSIFLPSSPSSSESMARLSDPSKHVVRERSRTTLHCAFKPPVEGLRWLDEPERNNPCPRELMEPWPLSLGSYYESTCLNNGLVILHWSPQGGGRMRRMTRGTKAIADSTNKRANLSFVYPVSWTRRGYSAFGRMQLDYQNDYE